MTYFGVALNGCLDVPGLEALLLMTGGGAIRGGDRFFSCIRDNTPPPIPNTGEVLQNTNNVFVYNNTMNQVKTPGLHVPKGTDIGGTGTAYLPWITHGDASDIHTPTPPASLPPGANATDFDAYIRVMKVGIAQAFCTPGGVLTNNPIMFAWCHEQRTNNTAQIAVGVMNPADGTGGNGLAADYAASFRHVSALMNDSYGPGQPGWPAGLASGALRDQGIVQMCHVPDIAQYLCEPSLPVPAGDTTPEKTPPSKVSLVEPGAAYVDFYGVDFYPSFIGTTTTPRLANIKGAWDMVSLWAANHGKPFVVGEWGIHGTPTAAQKHAFAQMWTDSIAEIRTFGTSGAGSCYAWCTYTASMTDDTDPVLDDGSGRIQAVIGTSGSFPSGNGIINNSFYKLLGDNPPPPPPPPGSGGQYFRRPGFR